MVLALYLPYNLIYAGITTDSFQKLFGATGSSIFYNINTNILAVCVEYMALVGIAGLVEASITGKASSWLDALRLGWKTSAGFLAQEFWQVLLFCSIRSF